MITIYKKACAMTLALTFFVFIGSSTMPLPAHPVTAESGSAVERPDSGPQYFEREMQAGTRLEKRNILPVILIGAAVVVGVFLVVMMVSKVKYNIGGTWDFKNTFTTAGHADFDSVWTFSPYDTLNPVQGTYRRTVNGVTVGSGSFTVVNKKDVIFYGLNNEEEYTGQFDEKKTMSGSFALISGAQGSWKASKR